MSLSVSHSKLKVAQDPPEDPDEAGSAWKSAVCDGWRGSDMSLEAGLIARLLAASATREGSRGSLRFSGVWRSSQFLASIVFSH
jgi:hypothetical protein